MRHSPHALCVSSASSVNSPRRSSPFSRRGNPARAFARLAWAPRRSGSRVLCSKPPVFCLAIKSEVSLLFFSLEYSQHTTLHLLQMHNIVIPLGFLMSSHLWYSAPASLSHARARMGLCSLAIGRARSAPFSGNHDRLAWGQLDPSPSWLEGSGPNVFLLPYTNWPARAHLLVSSSWAQPANRATFPGSCPLEWPTWMGARGQPQLRTAVYFTSNDHFACVRLCAENMWNHLAWFWREGT